MGASPAHHAVCVPVSERYVCCFMLFPFLLHASGSCSHTPVGRCQSFTFFNSVQFCPSTSSNFLFSAFLRYTALPALQACRKRFDHTLSLPMENWTCFIEAHPHVLCAHSAVHVQCDHRSISSTSNVRVPLIQHHDVSNSDKFLYLNERLLALLNGVHL